MNFIKNIKHSIKSNPYEWISALVLFVYFFPLVFLPHEARFLIHDNLDSNPVWYKTLADSRLMFASGSSVLDFTMGGIPRDCYPSEWDITVLLYWFFSPQIAYSINYILLHLIAFIGMYLLLKKYISQNSIVIYLTALSFSLLPFWPSGGITVAGLPLLVYAILNFAYKQGKILDWIIVVLFPFYSSLTFGNTFSYSFLFLLVLIGVVLKYWKLSFKIILPFIILAIVSIFVEHRLIGLLFSDFQYNRMADVPNAITFMNIKGIIGASILAFVFGHYHFHSLNAFITLIMVVFCFVFLIKGKFKEVKNILLLLAIVVMFAFLIIISENYNIKELFGEKFPKISLRLWVWFPLLWYIILAAVSEKLNNYGQKYLTLGDS